MNNEIARYERMLSKKLPCTGADKAKLLISFRSSLSSFSEEYPSPTMAELRTAFGPPEEMARLLAEGITDTEKAKYRKSKLFYRALLGVVLAVICALTVYIYIFKEVGLTYAEKTNILDNTTATTAFME